MYINGIEIGKGNERVLISSWEDYVNNKDRLIALVQKYDTVQDKLSSRFLGHLYSDECYYKTFYITAENTELSSSIYFILDNNERVSLEELVATTLMIYNRSDLSNILDIDYNIEDKIAFFLETAVWYPNSKVYVDTDEVFSVMPLVKNYMQRTIMLRINMGKIKKIERDIKSAWYRHYYMDWNDESKDF